MCTIVPGGGNVMCVCLYQKSVCKLYRTEGIYSTYESWYLDSLGEYICLLLIVLLRNKFNIYVIYYLHI